MPQITGKVVIALKSDGRADMEVEGLDELQTVQLFLVSAERIIQNLKASRGDSSRIVI